MSGGTTISVWGAVAWWLTPRSQDPEVGGFEPHLGRRVVSLSKIYLPRKRWLRPNMTEKMFTGTLSFKQTKTISVFMVSSVCSIIAVCAR